MKYSVLCYSRSRLFRTVDVIEFLSITPLFKSKGQCLEQTGNESSDMSTSLMCTLSTTLVYL